VQEYADELRAYHEAGLILLQDGNGRALDLDEVLGGAPAKAPAKAAASVPPPAPEPEEESAEEDEGEEAEPESEEAESYADWDYAELVAEVKGRGLEPESKKKDDLVAALEEDDLEEDE
jgi:ribosomal protein L12E/L44/L45/RPP1/RPP2